MGQQTRQNRTKSTNFGCTAISIPVLLWLADKIFGDLAERFYWPFLRWLWSFSWLPWVGWIIALFLLLAVAASSNTYKGRVTAALGARDSATEMLRLYAIVVQSVDNLREPTHGRDRAKDLTRVILSQTGKVFGGMLMRSSVYLPDGDFLTLFASHQLPLEGYERRFYIGDDPTRLKGVAGMAYVTKQAQVAKVVEQQGDLRFDHKDYVPLDPANSAPQYRSFIAAPILMESPGSTYTIGVLCLDSQDIAAFDSLGTQDLALSVGQLVAHAIDLHAKINQDVRDPVVDA